jgi:UDP-2,3-diacylglucosamine hydrolase
MSVAVIADCHIGGVGGAVEPLVSQLEAMDGSTCRRLVLLGDVFQVWVAARRFETPEVRRFLDAVSGLRARGVPVTYIEGNRDFFLRGGPYADRFDAVVDEVVFEAAGRRWLAVHGDGLDPADRQYRFWRFLSKNPLSRTVAHLLPRRLAHAWIHRTERRLAATNFRHKVRIPEEALQRYAAARLAGGGLDAVLFGHYHEARHWQVAGGEARILEAWFHARQVHWL